MKQFRKIGKGGNSKYLDLELSRRDGQREGMLWKKCVNREDEEIIVATAHYV